MLEEEMIENLELYRAAEQLWCCFHNDEFESTLDTDDDEQAADILEKLLSNYLNIASTMIYENPYTLV